MELYNKVYNNKGISSAKEKFYVIGSFPYIIEKLYDKPTAVATCKWLAERHGYITTKGMLLKDKFNLFKKYTKDNPELEIDEVTVDQSIFDVMTNWVIYPSIKDMVSELGWDEET